MPGGRARRHRSRRHYPNSNRPEFVLHGRRPVSGSSRERAKQSQILVRALTALTHVFFCWQCPPPRSYVESSHAKSNLGGYDDGTEAVPRLRVLDLQVQMRRCPKPILAAVAGYAIGGGHILHMLCDITIAAENGVFGQIGPRTGSFDAGYGSSVLSALVGPKRAKEVWFLSRFYDAKEALDMGLVNAVVPLAQLEAETTKWCRRILQNSPTAIACLKVSHRNIDSSALNRFAIAYFGWTQQVVPLSGSNCLTFFLRSPGSTELGPRRRRGSASSRG